MKWLDRDAFRLPIYVGLATDKKKLDRELARMKVKEDLDAENGGATTHFLRNNKSDVCAIVCFFNWRESDTDQIHALLAHEAVHVFQEVCEIMGEDDPSCEFEAWTIQAIAQNLFVEFAKQTRKRKRRRKP